MAEAHPLGSQCSELADRANQCRATHEALKRQAEDAYWNAVGSLHALTEAVQEETGLSGVQLNKKVDTILQEARWAKTAESNEG